jgi:succinate-semialdehyde dehydrogenase/glutarate-semialdehyde dehydrogenase
MRNLLELSDPTLLRTQAWVDGAWLGSDATFPVTDPATGERLADVTDCSAAETAMAIDAAHEAQLAWAARPARERAALVANFADEMLSNEGDLARIIGYENGKPMSEAVGEVRYAASFLTWFAEEARRVDGSVIPSPWAGTAVLAVREPVGVAAVITPWNFPAAMLTRKIGAAFAVGCTIVAKPAEQTPLTALALAELSDRVGFPHGVFNVVTGSAVSAPLIGAEMTSNRLVRKVSFTGSTAVGRLLAAQSAPTVKRLSLELGGNAPLIVFDDADLEVAIAGTLIAKFRNSGQTCVAANRIFVHEAIEAEFVARLSDAVAALTVGPFDSGSDIGPLIDSAAVTKVEEHIADAVASGARILAGGTATDRGPQFFAPTILSGTTPTMECHQAETFGPVVSLTAFASTDEVVAMANDTDSGLAAYIFTRDHARVWDVSRRLDYGMVGVNTGLISAPEVPFGGVKQSGIGREGSGYGTDDWTEIKYIAMAGVGSTP